MNFIQRGVVSKVHMHTLREKYPHKRGGIQDQMMDVVYLRGKTLCGVFSLFLEKVEIFQQYPNGMGCFSWKKLTLSGVTLISIIIVCRISQSYVSQAVMRTTCKLQWKKLLKNSKQHDTRKSNIDHLIFIIQPQFNHPIINMEYSDIIEQEGSDEVLYTCFTQKMELFIPLRTYIDIYTSPINSH